MNDKQKIEKLIEALSYYADAENWGHEPPDDDTFFLSRTIIYGEGRNGGETARKALEEIGQPFKAKEKPFKKEIVTWTMSNGRKIKITDMTTSHLRNAINMVARKFNEDGTLGLLIMDNRYNEMIKELESRE